MGAVVEMAAPNDFVISQRKITMTNREIMVHNHQITSPAALLRVLDEARCRLTIQDKCSKTEHDQWFFVIYELQTGICYSCIHAEY